MAASSLLHTVGSQDRGSSCSQPRGSFCRLPPISLSSLSLSFPPSPSLFVCICACVCTRVYIHVCMRLYICACVCVLFCIQLSTPSVRTRQEEGAPRERPCWSVGQRAEKPAGGRTQSAVLFWQEPPPHSQADRVNLDSREEGFLLSAPVKSGCS